MEQIESFYINNRWARPAALCGLILGGALLIPIAGGFPPWAWRYLFQVLPQLPQLWVANGAGILLPLVGLILLSLSLLLTWGILLLLIWKVAAQLQQDYLAHQDFQDDLAEAERLAEQQLAQEVDTENRTYGHKSGKRQRATRRLNERDEERELSQAPIAVYSRPYQRLPVTRKQQIPPSISPAEPVASNDTASPVYPSLAPAPFLRDIPEHTEEAKLPVPTGKQTAGTTSLRSAMQSAPNTDSQPALSRVIMPVEPLAGESGPILMDAPEVPSWMKELLAANSSQHQSVQNGAQASKPLQVVRPTNEDEPFFVTDDDTLTDKLKSVRIEQHTTRPPLGKDISPFNGGSDFGGANSEHRQYTGPQAALARKKQTAKPAGDVPDVANLPTRPNWLAEAPTQPVPPELKAVSGQNTGKLADLPTQPVPPGLREKHTDQLAPVAPSRRNFLIEDLGVVDNSPFLSPQQRQATGTLKPVSAGQTAGSHLPNMRKKTRPLAIEETERRETAGRLVVGVGLDPGIVRKNQPNEDNLFALQGLRATEHGTVPAGLFIVADGMGGHANGKEASKLAVQTVSDAIVPVLLREVSGTSIINQESHFLELLKESVHRANLAIYQRNREQAEMMGTTLTAALVVNTTAYIANIGDSRTYLYRASEGLRQVTRDHSPVADMVQKGLLQPEDLYTHPHRNQINRCLGDKATVRVDTFIEHLQINDILLLCSDGLWEMVRDRDIEKIIATSVHYPTQISSVLIQSALHQGGADNVSVVAAGLLKSAD